MRIADALFLPPEDRRRLEAWAKERTAPARLVERARILLLLAEGVGIRPAARRLHVGLNTIRRWRDRFLEAGSSGIEHDAPGRGRKPVITAERKAEIVRMTTQEQPRNATHWSLSRMADAAGVSPFVVWKIWKEHGLKPHLIRTFKVSDDPHFVEKVERLFRDISENRLRRGVFRSVEELEAAIHEYLARHNECPKPFIWTATHQDILGKVARAKATLTRNAKD